MVEVCMVHHKFIVGMATLPQININSVIMSIWGAAFYFTMNIAFTIVIHLPSTQVLHRWWYLFYTPVIWSFKKSMGYTKLMHILGNHFYWLFYFKFDLSWTFTLLHFTKFVLYLVSILLWFLYHINALSCNTC
jgi:hypothetical protein